MALYLALRFLYMAICLTLAVPILSGKQAHSFTRCEKLYRNIKSFEELAETPKFQILLSALPTVPPALLKRYWRDPLVDQIKRNIQSDLQSQSNIFTIPDRGFFVTRVLVLEDHLFLDLVHIQAIINGTKIKQGESVQGANTLLIKTLTAFLKLSVEILEENREITTVVIKGVNLKNKMLIQFLVENGFTQKDRNRTRKDFEKILNLSP